MKMMLKETMQKNDPPVDGMISMISTDRLFPNPSQPRFVFDDESLLRLSDSIKRHGMLQPLSVRPVSEGLYQIIAGERRWRAARIIGMSAVPCIVLDVDAEKSAELALIENIQREDLNIFEQAAAIASLIDVYGLTQDQAAKQLSSSQSHIANKLRILKLTPPERTEIIKNKLTERHARSLLRINDSDTRLDVIKVIVKKGLNVSETDRYIDSVLNPSPVAPKPSRLVKGFLKDIRFFNNTVNKAVGMLRDCGYTVSSSQAESDGATVITISIKHIV